MWLTRTITVTDRHSTFKLNSGAIEVTSHGPVTETTAAPGPARDGWRRAGSHAGESRSQYY